MSKRFRAGLQRGGRSRPGVRAGSGELLQHLYLALDWLTHRLPNNFGWSPEPSVSLVAANHSSPNPVSSPASSYPTPSLLGRGGGEKGNLKLGFWVSGSQLRFFLETVFGKQQVGPGGVDL